MSWTLQGSLVNKHWSEHTFTALETKQNKAQKEEITNLKAEIDKRFKKMEKISKTKSSLTKEINETDKL